HKYYEIQILLARTYWTLGRVYQAQKVLNSLAKNLKNQHPLDEIFWLRGRMAEEQGQFESAASWFKKGLQEIREKKGESLERLKWYLAWNLRKLRRFEEANQFLEELRAISESDFSRSRYTYWLAVNLRDLERIDDSHSTLKTLIEEDPIGYYGLLAHRETQTLVAIPGLKGLEKDSRSTPTHRSLKRVLDRPYIEWLISVGEKEIASLYLDQVADNYRKSNAQDELGWAGLFRFYARSGVFLSLYKQMGLLDPNHRTALLNHYPDLIFPTPYLEEVASAANHFGVSAELIYSIMRQESAFDPLARSTADAFGLMQLLPEVAHRTAQRSLIKFEKAEDLYEPQVNIPLGSAFLRELWDKFNGQFVLTVASYNASEEAIYGWLRTRFRGNTLEFIEDIPYEETRSYIRLVMRNLVFYSLMSAGGNSIPFPEWTLSLSAPSSLSASP
ncbi:MAG: DUF3808 domain-containing protein, partial [Bdellovibrionales bacterium]|nr:DUF3808 domain-containing protein [Bdellovibrionales bacterium]